MGFFIVKAAGFPCECLFGFKQGKIPVAKGTGGTRSLSPPASRGGALSASLPRALIPFVWRVDEVKLKTLGHSFSESRASLPGPVSQQEPRGERTGARRRSGGPWVMLNAAFPRDGAAVHFKLARCSLNRAPCSARAGRCRLRAPQPETRVGPRWGGETRVSIRFLPQS